MELDAEELREQGAVTVEVWDWDMVGKNDFLGKVKSLEFSSHAIFFSTN